MYCLFLVSIPKVKILQKKKLLKLNFVNELDVKKGKFCELIQNFVNKVEISGIKLMQSRRTWRVNWMDGA